MVVGAGGTTVRNDPSAVATGRRHRLAGGHGRLPWRGRAAGHRLPALVATGDARADGLAAHQRPAGPAARAAARAERVAGAGSSGAAAVGGVRPTAAAVAGGAGVTARRRPTGGARGPRVGPPAPRRRVGALAGTGGHRRILVAPAGLVGAAGPARGRGAVLRRLGRLGAAGRAAGLCLRPGRYGRFSQRGPPSPAAVGERAGRGPSPAKEGRHDYAREC